MNILLFLISILCLSQSANLIRLASASPDVIGFWRLLGAAVFMSVLFFGKNRSFRAPKLSKNAWIMTVFSGIFFFLHLWTYSYAAQNTKIANCVILFAINPLVTASITFLFMKERLPAKLAIAYLLAFIGIYQLVAHGVSFEPADVAGNFSALLSAILYSAYILTGHKARKEVENIHFSLIIYLIAAGCFFFSGSLQHMKWTGYSDLTWWAIAGTVIVSTIGGHALFSYLLKSMNINLMSCGKLAEPVFASLTAFLLFGETLSRQTLIAFAFAATALLILFSPWQFLPQRKISKKMD